MSQKVVDGFGRHLVDRLGVPQGRIDSILVKISIQEFFFNDSSSLPGIGFVVRVVAWDPRFLSSSPVGH